MARVECGCRVWQLVERKSREAREKLRNGFARRECHRESVEELRWRKRDCEFGENEVGLHE